MFPGELVAAGQVTTGNTVTLSPSIRTTGWMICNHTAAGVTVYFNGDSRITITIPSFNAQFVEIAGNYQSMHVSGATVDYIVFA